MIKKFDKKDEESDAVGDRLHSPPPPPPLDFGTAGPGAWAPLCKGAGVGGRPLSRAAAGACHGPSPGLRSLPWGPAQPPAARRPRPAPPPHRPCPGAVPPRGPWRGSEARGAEAPRGRARLSGWGRRARAMWMHSGAVHRAAFLGTPLTPTHHLPARLCGTSGAGAGLSRGTEGALSPQDRSWSWGEWGRCQTALENTRRSGSNPFQHLEKSTVLQEARLFNETPINPRRCLHILTKILYLLNQGEHFGTTEATEAFFAMTRLFQSNDVSHFYSEMKSS
nr:forkhead box protein D1 [Oryctolagus cuniculus]